MRKVLVLTTALAGLAFAVSTANADFFIREADGQRFVVNADTNVETVLLTEENGVAPATCPAGSFWQTADGSIIACDDAAAMFTLVAPQPGVLLPSGDPFPENAMLLVPKESGEQKRGETGDAAAEEPATDINEEGTEGNKEPVK